MNVAQWLEANEDLNDFWTAVHGLASGVSLDLSQPGVGADLSRLGIMGLAEALAVNVMDNLEVIDEHGGIVVIDFEDRMAWECGLTSAVYAKLLKIITEYVYSACYRDVLASKDFYVRKTFEIEEWLDCGDFRGMSLEMIVAEWQVIDVMEIALAAANY